MTVNTIPSLLSDSGLARYIEEIKKFPLLSAEKEQYLAKRYHNNGDLKAAHTLVTSHLRMVVKVALSYRGYGLPISDLIAEGNIGVMKAVKKFDPDKGFRLSTYAAWWVKATIQEFILKSWSLVKIGTTSTQKKLFFNLRKLKNKMRLFDNINLTSEQAETIAKSLDVSVGDVHQMNSRLSGGDQSLNTMLSNEDDAAEKMEMLQDPDPNPETFYINAQEENAKNIALYSAVQTLKSREQDIFIARYLKEPPQTLETLSQIHDISRERVRQIEKQAFDKVKKVLNG